MAMVRAAVDNTDVLYRDFFELAPVGIAHVHRAGRFMKVNRRLCAILGYSADELLSMTFFDVTHKDDVDMSAGYRKEMENALREAFIVEKRYIHKNGQTVWANIVSQRHVRDGEPFFVTMIEDITARKRLETMRAGLVQRIVDAQELERQRIALELHDSFGQTLAALGVRIAAIQQAESTTPVAADLADLRSLVQELTDETSSLVRRLRPPLLDELGLIEAIRRLTDSAEDHGLDVVVEFTGSITPDISKRAELALYRIVQEAITNTTKHAAAKVLSVVGHLEGSTVRIVVEDDGCGFELDPQTGLPPESTGFGLFGMRERMLSVGGKLKLESSPDNGTSVYATLGVC